VGQAQHAIYERSNRKESLRQGEILTDLIEVRLRLSSLTEKTPLVDQVNHPYAVIVSQDCDLIQDFGARNQGGVSPDKLIPAVLFCEVITAEELRGRDSIKTDIWKRIRANKDERYAFLEKFKRKMMPVMLVCRSLGWISKGTSVSQQRRFITA
jgi:hypothetical protein